MCGFIAVASMAQLPAALIDAAPSMLHNVSHRGPDKSSYKQLSNCMMAHARLSIVGGESGGQPMGSPDGRYWILFNGEIYDYKTKQRELESCGIVFRGSSDTEVALHGFIYYGPDFFKCIDGIFSVFIWDNYLKEVLVFRDRFGVKPLYVSIPENKAFIAVSSELNGLSPLRKIGALSLVQNQLAITHFLTMGYVVEPATWYQDTFSLMPGQYGHFKQGGFQLHFYWKPTVIMSTNKKHNDDDLKSAFSESLSAQLPDSAFSIFLSGGIDSSLLAAFARRNSVFDIFAKTAKFEGEESSDYRLAKDLASRLEIPLESVDMEPSQSMSAAFISNIYHEPFSDSAALPTSLLAKSASTHGKVVWSGDGADELFFGYRNHRLLYNENRVRSLLPNWSLRPLKSMASFFSDSHKLPRPLRWKRTISSIGSSIQHSYFLAIGASSPGKGVSVLKDSKRIDPDVFIDWIAKNRGESVSGLDSLFVEDPMKWVQWMDLAVYLPSCVLKKVDRSTMHYGVEARVPFLGKSISDYALSLSSRGQIRSNTGKIWLRRAAHDMLPVDHALAPKTPFSSPIDKWIDRVFLSQSDENFMSSLSSHSASSVVSESNLALLIKEHRSGRYRHGTLLWSIIQLSNFEKMMSLHGVSL